MRVCVIGNSHTVSLMEAWKEVSAASLGLEVRFFASPAGGLASLTVQANQLVTPRKYVSNFLKQTSGGLDAIVPSEFDVCLVYGLRLDVPDLGWELSQAAVEQCCADAVTVSINLQICRMIRCVSSIPVFSGRSPMPVRLDTDSERAPDSIPYKDIFLRLRDSMAAEGVVLLGQPTTTVEEPFGTLKKYSLGSRKLLEGRQDAEEHDPEERRHMNSAYGRLFLTGFLEMVRTAAPGA